MVYPSARAYSLSVLCEVLLQKASKWDVKVCADRMDSSLTKSHAEQEFATLRPPGAGL